MESVDDICVAAKKQQAKRARRFYAIVWGLGILAVTAGALLGWFDVFGLR